MIEDNNAVLLAEYRLLNACYSNPDFLYENGVTEDIFQHSQSKTIFNSIKSLYESKVPLTSPKYCNISLLMVTKGTSDITMFLTMLWSSCQIASMIRI